MIDIENKVENEEEVAEEESEFADEIKEEEKPVEEPKAEEEAPVAQEEAAPAVEMQKEEEPAEAEEEPSLDVQKDDKGTVVGFGYPEESLKKIEEGRGEFYKTYRKSNMIKWVITFIVIAVVLAAWIVPGQFPEEHYLRVYQLQFTIGALVIALGGLWLSSFFFKRSTDASMKKYFHNYYECTDSYVFGDMIYNKEGDVDCKLDQQVLIDSNLYADIYKVGSRNCINFDRAGQHFVFSDCAAQIRGQKALQTVFVGKLLVTENNWEGDDMIIYLKGNKRALPPTTLNYYELLEDSKYMVVYGSITCKKFLTKKVREALAQFKTNNTLVDVAISIRGGKTYVAMGYEDNLMILPMDKVFDPRPTMQFKKDIDKVFDLIDAIENR